ncbi:PAM68 family protein [Baaleninema sp.]|uniref:PAM68 family protein n=1 Tax=Baaleninema sp. TaxID=3101197 RepID=UPI003D06A4CB
MASDPQRNRLPFEPGKKRKAKAKKNAPQPERDSPPQPSRATQSEPARSQSATPSQPASSATGSRASRQQTAIPEAVGRRMLARVGLFSGTPTLLGILSLVGSYFVVSREWFPLPNVAVLLVSMGCFGLGVLGVSYGVLSASWDEDDEGTKLGIQEFQTNFGRLRQAWRSAQQKD